MVAHAFNPSAWEAEAVGAPWVQGEPGLQSELQDNQGWVTQRNLVSQKQKQKQKQKQQQNKTKKNPTTTNNKKSILF